MFFYQCSCVWHKYCISKVHDRKTYANVFIRIYHHLCGFFPPVPTITLQAPVPEAASHFSQPDCTPKQSSKLGCAISSPSITGDLNFRCFAYVRWCEFKSIHMRHISTRITTWVPICIVPKPMYFEVAIEEVHWVMVLSGGTAYIFSLKWGAFRCNSSGRPSSERREQHSHAFVCHNFSYLTKKYNIVNPTMTCMICSPFPKI